MVLLPSCHRLPGCHNSKQSKSLHRTNSSIPTYYYSHLLNNCVNLPIMAPVLIRRVLDSSIWSTIDAPQPTLPRRYISTGSNSALFVIPLAVFIFLVVFGCTLSALRLRRAKARNKAIAVSLPLGVPRTIRRPQAASVPPPMSDDVLDPPPPYAPLQILAPAHKRVNDTLERPADTERNVGNRGRGRSMLEV
jgi:hypothetical protein